MAASRTLEIREPTEHVEPEPVAESRDPEELRHDELVWELSALHTHWLNAYDQEGSPSAPLAWHRDFADARNRLREWVSTCGTRLDRDRPTRLTTWPGEEPVEPGVEVVIEDREADFHAYVMEDVAARRRIEERARAVARAS
jgi:hypothetical protein